MKTKAAFEAVAQRITNAEDNFIAYAMATAGLTKAQATKALTVYKKAKVIKIDAVGGQYTFVHGAFAEAQTLKNAAAQ